MKKAKSVHLNNLLQNNCITFQLVQETAVSLLAYPVINQFVVEPLNSKTHP